MNEAIKQLIAAERKYKRELQELRDLRHTITKHKAPDTKLIALIDQEIKNYTEPK